MPEHVLAQLVRGLQLRPVPPDGQQRVDVDEHGRAHAGRVIHAGGQLAGGHQRQRRPVDQHRRLQPGPRRGGQRRSLSHDRRTARSLEGERRRRHVLAQRGVRADRHPGLCGDRVHGDAAVESKQVRSRVDLCRCRSCGHRVLAHAHQRPAVPGLGRHGLQRVAHHSIQADGQRRLDMAGH